MLTIGHLSDIHLSPIELPKRRDLLNKRLLGYLNWRRNRHNLHLRDSLDQITADLLARKPDHIVVTGDLVNLALPSEFAAARIWLETLGSPEHVTVIPGNHDAYVHAGLKAGWEQWRPYMRPFGDGAGAEDDTGIAFPFVRRLGDVALIGLSSAIVTGPFLAQGALGDRQRHALLELLRELGAQSVCRVVLIHHPPLSGQTPRLRALRDARELTRILSAEGAELVLHGHNHTATVARLATVAGQLPIVGVGSASTGTHRHWPLAQYNLYHVNRVDERWRIEMQAFGLATNAPGRVSELSRTVL